MSVGSTEIHRGVARSLSSPSARCPKRELCLLPSRTVSTSPFLRRCDGMVVRVPFIDVTVRDHLTSGSARRGKSRTIYSAIGAHLEHGMQRTGWIFRHICFFCIVTQFTLLKSVRKSQALFFEKLTIII